MEIIYNRVTIAVSFKGNYHPKDNHIDSNETNRSLKETVRNTTLKGDKIDDIKNENDTAMFFSTRSKSRSSTFQLNLKIVRMRITRIMIMMMKHQIKYQK